MTDVDQLLRRPGPPPALPVDETALRSAVTTARTRRRRRGAAVAGVSALAVAGAFAAAQPLLGPAEPDRLVVADAGPNGRPGPATHGPERPAAEPAPGGTLPAGELPEGRFPPPGRTVPVVASDPAINRVLAAYTSTNGRPCLALNEPYGGALECPPSIDPDRVTVYAAGPVLGGLQGTDRLTPPVVYGTVPQTVTSVVITGPNGSEDYGVVDGGPAPVNYYLTRHKIDGPTVVAAYDADGDLVAHAFF